MENIIRMPINKEKKTKNPETKSKKILSGTKVGHTGNKRKNG